MELRPGGLGLVVEPWNSTPGGWGWGSRLGGLGEWVGGVGGVGGVSWGGGWGGGSGLGGWGEWGGVPWTSTLGGAHRRR